MIHHEPISSVAEPYTAPDWMFEEEETTITTHRYVTNKEDGFYKVIENKQYGNIATHTVVAMFINEEEARAYAITKNTRDMPTHNIGIAENV